MSACILPLATPVSLRNPIVAYRHAKTPRALHPPRGMQLAEIIGLLIIGRGFAHVRHPRRKSWPTRLPHP